MRREGRGFAVIFRTGDGVDLYHETTGSGDRIILTHGSWGDGRSWAGVVDGLAARHEVVTWDRRGHSRSSDGAHPGRFQRDAEDLAELIGHLGGTVHLVGSSSGSSIVLKAAVSHPNLVRSVCVHEPDMLGLVDPERYSSELERERRENLHVIDLVTAGRPDEAARYFIDEIAVGPGAWESLPEGARRGFIAQAATVVDEVDDGVDPDPIDPAALDALGRRLLITRGTESPPLLVAVAEALERSVPKVRHVTLDGAGHLPYRTHPQLWTRTVLEFIDSLED